MENMGVKGKTISKDIYLSRKRWGKEKATKNEDSFQGKVLRGRQFQMYFLKVWDSFKKFASY